MNVEYTLTRIKFNELSRYLVERTAIPVRNTLTDVGIAASELGKVILLGGSTKISAAQQKDKNLPASHRQKNQSSRMRCTSRCGIGEHLVRQHNSSVWQKKHTLS